MPEARVLRLMEELRRRGKWVRGLKKEIADQTGYTNSHVCKVFKGQVEPSNAFLFSVCDSYSINRSYVLNGEEEGVHEDNPLKKMIQVASTQWLLETFYLVSTLTTADSTLETLRELANEELKKRMATWGKND